MNAKLDYIIRCFYAARLFANIWRGDFHGAFISFPLAIQVTRIVWEV